MPEQLPITTYGMDILRKEAKPIHEIDSSLIELVHNMYYTMLNAEGIGLAAPQVNVNKSICIVDISCIEEFKHIKPLTLINPVIADNHGESSYEEGCLSIPEVRAEVKRPEKIFVKYNDFDMKDLTLEADGMLARVIQHEIDHLHGKLFVDHLDPDELKKLKSSLNKIKKHKVQPNYPIFNGK